VALRHPNTIVFGRDGREIVQRQSYIAPREMVSTLMAVADSSRNFSMGTAWSTPFGRRLLA
jgi:hypothetical protein